MEPMHLFIPVKWRYTKSVKHSAWPARASLIRASSWKAASGVVIAISSVPNWTRSSRSGCYLIRGANLLPTRSFPPGSSYMEKRGFPLAKNNESCLAGYRHPGRVRQFLDRVPDKIADTAAFDKYFNGELKGISGQAQSLLGERERSHRANQP